MLTDDFNRIAPWLETTGGFIWVDLSLVRKNIRYHKSQQYGTVDDVRLNTVSKYNNDAIQHKNGSWQLCRQWGPAPSIFHAMGLCHVQLMSVNLYAVVACVFIELHTATSVCSTPSNSSRALIYNSTERQLGSSVQFRGRLQFSPAFNTSHIKGLICPRDNSFVYPAWCVSTHVHIY